MTIIIAILLMLASFYVLAVVTEHYFVPAIDILARKLKLSSDAAGATLLAMGSSAPEFFTSLIAVLGVAGDHADVGAGAIVGSAIFNVLVIIGAAAMFKAVTIQWQPVSRDLVFYVFTILLLLYAFSDGRITIIEALVFVATYISYVVAVVHWRKVLTYKNVSAPDSQESIQDSGWQSLVHKVLQLFTPDVHKKPRLYLVTFMSSILIIAGLSWLLVEQVVLSAEILHINPTFLALTVLAAGTSVPDLIGSIVVAKQGRGDMAVSNAIGSNIFDVLFGLGFPWLLALTVRGGVIQVGNENLQSSVILLFATVVAILSLLLLRKWRLGRYSGLLLIGMYVAYVVYIIASV